MSKCSYRTIFDRRTRLRSGILGVVLALALAIGGPALALPLLPGGDHPGENHSWEDHSREVLPGINLTDAILIGIDFNRTILTNSALTGANLTDANLFRAVLDDSDLSDAILVNADVRRASFVRAVLDGADLDNADLRRSDLTDAVLTDAVLTGANLSNITYNAVTDFTGALYDDLTTFPSGFDTSGMILVPEPATAAMLGLGLALIALRRRR